jgi:hypothetical protein
MDPNFSATRNSAKILAERLGPICVQAVVGGLDIEKWKCQWFLGRWHFGY